MILHLALFGAACAQSAAAAQNIVVFDFRNSGSSASDWMGPAIAEYATLVLKSNTGFISAPREHVALHRDLLNIKPGKPLTFEKQQRIFERLAADAMVEGSYTLSNSSLKFRGSVSFAETGDIKDISFTLDHFSLDVAQEQLISRLGNALGATLKHSRKSVWGTGSDDAYENHWKGMIALQEEEYDRAEQYFKAAIKNDSGYADPRIALARVYIENKKYTSAVSQLEKCMDLAPDSAMPHYYLGVAYIKMKKRSAASSHLRDAVDKDPSNPLFRLRLGDFYKDTNLYDKALDELNSAVKLDPALAPAWYSLASIFALVKKRDKALEYLEKAVIFGGKSYARKVKKDPDFEWLSRDRKFKQILKKGQ